MIRKVGRFTVNKQVVRQLQRETIEEFLSNKLGSLRYFGLCSPEMKDVLDWAPLLGHIEAVERGKDGREHLDQHLLRLTATRQSFQNKVRLLCGDIDHIILTGEDENGNAPSYPFDLVSLDYSGGLFYQNETKDFYRLEALRKLIEVQASAKAAYVLFLSANCHAIDAGEVRTAIETLRTELNRDRWNADHVCDAYLNHSDDRARLKLYVPLFVGHEAASRGYVAQTKPVILYEGNSGAQMVSFRFFLEPDQPRAIRRFPKHRFNQILNTPCIKIADGKKRKATLSLPKLTANDAR